MNLQFEDIREDTLILLIIRANETKRQNARVRDRKALEILETLDIDTKGLDRAILHECVIARTVLFDSAVKEAVGREPKAVCVNLDCGLDNRFVRVDNGWIQWYNVDTGEQIEVRKKAFSGSRREKTAACNFSDRGWTDQLPKDLPVIIIAEDLLPHYTREQIKSFLDEITGAFPKGVLIAELARRKTKKRNAPDDAESKAPWGFVYSGKDLTLLDESGRMSFVKETTFTEQMKKDGLKAQICGLLAGIMNNRVSVFEWKKAAENEKENTSDEQKEGENI